MDNAAKSLISALIDAGNIDTVYRDAYVDRARGLLAPVLSLEEFHRGEQDRASLAQLPPRIAHALETANWKLVKELSERGQALQHVMENRGALLETARSVYDVPDVALDPFSPGLQSFTRIPAREWPALRTRALELLGTLERSDTVWKDFYAARRQAFEGRPETAPDIARRDAATSASSTDVLEAARRALKTGDMKRLAALADALGAGQAQGGTSPSHAGNAESAPAQGQPSQQLQPIVHSGETLARARRLGLAPRHLEPRTEFASLHQYAWTPLSDGRADSATARLQLPSGAPEGLREGFVTFMLHPLVNSGGARYLPSLAAEDLLVEDFPDPKDDQSAPASELVKSLGFSSRRGLPRGAVEQALLMHGGRILDDLGLDPRVFRLVCIPPDVYVRLGEVEGWGRQPFWTHFDGYLIRIVDGQVRLQALAGGDVRYGGLFDLLAVGRDYDSDHLLARFAIVQRARMVAW